MVKLVLLLLIFVAANGSAEEIDATNKKLNSIASEIQKLSEKDKSLGASIQKTAKKLKRSDKALSKASADARKLSVKLEKKQKGLDSLKAKTKKTTETIIELKAELQKSLIALQKLGSTPAAKKILSPQDVSANQRFTYWFKYLSEIKQKQLDSLQAAELDLVRLEKEGEIELKELKSLTKKQKRKLAEVAEIRNKSRKQAKALAKQRVKGKQALKKLEADKARLATLVERLRFAKAYPDFATDGKTPFGKLKGKLSWPLKGRIVPSQFSKGVTIEAKPGTKVRAVSHGRVVFSDWMRGFGLLTIIDHGDGYMTLYGQNESLYMSNGDWVEPGTVISASGQSGGANTSGVYFEIRKNINTLDTKKWCRLGN